MEIDVIFAKLSPLDDIFFFFALFATFDVFYDTDRLIRSILNIYLIKIEFVIFKQIKNCKLNDELFLLFLNFINKN